jgi:hypothetical protein
LKSAKGAPVTATATWIEKPVASRQPAAQEWVEYAVEWRLEAEGAIHTAVLLDMGDGELHYSRLPGDFTSDEVRIRLGFARHRESATWPDWPTDKEVWVSLSQSSSGANAPVSALVVSDALWLDPRPDVHTYCPAQLETASLVTLATSDSPRITASAVVLASDDVKVTHGRWKADLARLDLLPRGFEFLAEGRRSGQTNHSPDH